MLDNPSFSAASKHSEKSIFRVLLQRFRTEPWGPQSALSDVTKGVFPAPPFLEHTFGTVKQGSRAKDALLDLW